MKPINVLSLFDGMSCGQIALQRAGIPVANYFASEINKYAIKVTMENWGETLQLGSVCDVYVSESGIKSKSLQSNVIPDLLIGGSPCQDLSGIKSIDGKGLEGNKSKLFFEYVRILKEIQAVNPNIKFLLENVVMKPEYENIISEILGCRPYRINSALVSAQSRPRLYWTNIEGFVVPADKGLVLQDIMEKNVDEKLFYSYPLENVDLSKQVCAKMIFKNQDMHKRIFNPKHKVHTLTACGGGNTEKKVYVDGRARKLTPIEYERAQTVPDDYTKTVSDTQRRAMLGNGWTVDIIVEFFKHLNQPESIFSEPLDF